MEQKERQATETKKIQSCDAIDSLRIAGDSVTALLKLESCITEIKEWMNVNKLKLNEDKTEFFVASSKSNLKFIHEPSLNVCGSIITSSDSVRNLVIFLTPQCLCQFTYLQFHVF